MGKFEKFNSNLETRAIRNGRDIDQQWIIENEANELFSSKKKDNSVDDIYQKIIDAGLNKKELEEIKQTILNSNNEDDYDIVEQMESARQQVPLSSASASDDLENWLDELIFDDDYYSYKKR